MPGRSQYSENVVRRALRLYDRAVKAKSKSPTADVCRKTKIPKSTIDVWVKNRGMDYQSIRSPSREDCLKALVVLIKEGGADITWEKYKKLCPTPGAFQRHWKSWTLFRADALKLAGVTEEHFAVRERQRFEDRIQALGKQLKEAHREINAGEDVRQSIFKLADQPIDPPAWAVPKVPSKSKPGIPVLFASDFQWGEQIKANELDGINAFSAEIARTRYQRLIERTVDLCCHHMINPDYPGIVYLRGGDMISGDIHQELRETNDLQSIPAVIDLVNQEVAGIKILADRFGKVWVISVPGNHGRTTIKPHAKSFVETNYDYLSSCMIEREFAQDKRITFRTPMSGDARFALFGWWFLLTHGDRIGSSGGQGFIGPAATITRGMKKLVDYYATLGQHIDWTLVGHFHTRMELEYGLSNGSLPGYSEYAKTFRMRPQPPEQWLFFVHPAHGITCRWPIGLARRPKLSSSTTAVHIE